MIHGDVMMAIYLEHSNNAENSKGTGEHGASDGTRCGLESARSIIGGSCRIQTLRPHLGEHVIFLSRRARRRDPNCMEDTPEPATAPSVA